MSSILKTLRGLLISARELVFPTIDPPDPVAINADRQSQTLWHERFAPLGALIEDADVLELGCADGRLLAQLLSPAERARSAVGIDPSGTWIDSEGRTVWPEYEPTGRLELHTDLAYLQAFDLSSFDLVVVRQLESVFPLEEVEEGMRRVYDLLRPGGEALVHVGCGSPEGGAAGYGFLTPTSWIMLFMRMGFEIGAVRRVWRPDAAIDAARAILPLASDEERMTEEMTLRLIRPWESWELDKVWHARAE